ncbi:MAG: hypothetical protein ACD_46C00671G0010 [uncultured bacterium]|nr:MAG: hypothetical protein ACD_46C00671G0010 [uncultured bacterium]
MKKLACILLLLSQLTVAAWAETFVVQNIEIEGLQRISPATVKSYLPIKRGEVFNAPKSAAVLRSLYKTGFFDQIYISKQNGTLIIHVKERPTIGQLKISGNSIIPTDKLTTVMKSLDIAEGRVYNAEILEKIKQSLLNQYYMLGRYNARVDIDATPMSRNRISLKITISEGLVAKVRRITIIGNHVFDESKLTKQLDVTTSGLFTFITQSDRYSEEKLETSLDKLRSFYMDHGYLRFEIKSAQAQVTPDRKSVYITVVVNEGKPYTVKKYEIVGKIILPKKEIEDHINIQSGETFNRQKIIDAEKEINKLYGEKGYIFAMISLRPQVNDKTHEVILVFDIKPGKRAYVRHITFSDNNRTNDIVFRREMQQWEAAPVSTTKLEDSKQRLSLLPFIRNVDMSVKPVPEKDDQVDVNYKVTEDNSAQATFKVGIDQRYGMIWGAGLNQKNFFGTGNTLGLNFQHSRYEQFYTLDYTDPFYTIDGISRTLSLSISKVNPRAIANLNNNYTMNEYGAGVLYGIPIGQESGVINRVQAGVAYQNSLVYLSESLSKVSKQVMSFVNDHGRHFQEADFKIGYSRDSRDKAIFPTRGVLQSLYFDAFVPVSSSSVSFYMTNYHALWYQPLTPDYIMLSRADLGYANGFHGIHNYPFFKNYYAGGIDTVRGYQAFNLGPRDSNYQAFGGNMLADASVGLIFPNYLSDSLRTSAFFDAGNVYTSLNNRGFGGQSTNSGPIRYSVGIEADWLTPLGPIKLSLAQPIATRPHDKRDSVQFALGANF